jgi:peptidoglycan/xylan/chitin deacetylase (PgdA/CDA1 family)
MTFRFRRPHIYLLSALLFAATLPAQEVALTFDDLPRTGELPPNMTRVEIIRDIAQILASAHAPRVYGFVNAGKLANAPNEIEALKAWTAAGFLLANHGYSHLNLAQTSYWRYTSDITANEPLLRALVPNDAYWHWYRYPYLEEGETLRKKRAVATFLRKQHYRVAEVTLDFEDFLWNAPYARCVANNDTVAIDWLKTSYLIAAEDRIQFGQNMSRALYGRDIKHIMLLHVGGFETVMLPQLLNLLRQKHFKLVSLEEAASDPVYRTDPAWPTRHGGDFLTLSMRRRSLEIPSHRLLPKRQLNAVCRVTRTAMTRLDQGAKPSPQDRLQKTLRSKPTL